MTSFKLHRWRSAETWTTENWNPGREIPHLEREVGTYQNPNVLGSCLLHSAESVIVIKRPQSNQESE